MECEERKFSRKPENKQAMSAVPFLRVLVEPLKSCPVREQAAQTSKVWESTLTLSRLFLQDLTFSWFSGLTPQAAERKREVAILFAAKGILRFKKKQEQS